MVPGPPSHLRLRPVRSSWSNVTGMASIVCLGLEIVQKHEEGVLVAFLHEKPQRYDQHMMVSPLLRFTITSSHVFPKTSMCSS